MTTSKKLYFNGVKGSGDYGIPPTDVDAFVDNVVVAMTTEPPNLAELEAKKRRDDRIRYDKELFSLAKLEWEACEAELAEAEGERKTELQDKIAQAQQDIVDTISRLKNPEKRVLLTKKVNTLLTAVEPQLEAKIAELEMQGKQAEALKLETQLEALQTRADGAELASFEQLNSLIANLEEAFDVEAISDETERFQTQVELEVYDKKLQKLEEKITELTQLKENPGGGEEIRQLEYPEVEDLSYYRGRIEDSQEEGQSFLARIEERIKEIKRKLPEVQDFGAKEGVDVTNLAETGWGIIFHAKDPQTEAIKTALKPLLDLRRKEAGDKFRLYEKGQGRRPREDHAKFLGRFGVVPSDPADPDKVPYYLLLVGSPEQIPFDFQFQLDVQYAVGRLHFETIEEYANYAKSVVKAETSEKKLPRSATFFGVANDDDPATQSSAEHLITPLTEKFEDKDDFKDWAISKIDPAEATKTRLARLMGGDETPAFLFTASHGMEFEADDERQRPHQGALLCQEWPGPDHRDRIPEDWYFSADDLDDDDNLLGMIAFFFACFGAGTPQIDQFGHNGQEFKRTEIAPEDFVAALPMKMLNRPKGGALAVVAHVDRTWSSTFLDDRRTAQTVVFESTLQRLLKRYPVGAAMEYFNQRYAALASELTNELHRINAGYRAYDPYVLAGKWTANNDSRGYIILGDPAVRLNVAKVGESGSRSEIDGQTIPVASQTPTQTATSTQPTARTEPSLPLPPALSKVVSADEWEQTPLKVQQVMRRAMAYIDVIEKKAEDLELRGIMLPLFEVDE